MSTEHSSCLWGLGESGCAQVRQEAGVTTQCPSALACMLLKESYETRDMNWPEYFAYMRLQLACEHEQPMVAVGAAA